MRFIKLLIFSFLIFFGCVYVHAAEQEYKSIDEFINSLPPDPKVHFEKIAEGDLNQDGLSDRAILVGLKEADQLPLPKIFILLQTKFGKFFLAQESKEGEFTLSFVRASVTIDRGNLYFKTETSGVQGGEFATHQFKFYKDKWQLIGLSHHIIDFDLEVEGHSKGEMVDTDLNLLTDNIIFKHEKFNGKQIKR